MFSASSSLHNYQDDSDFDEAFKNLLKPIETISKQNHCEPLKYDLLKVIIYSITVGKMFSTYIYFRN